MRKQAEVMRTRQQMNRQQRAKISRCAGNEDVHAVIVWIENNVTGFWFSLKTDRYL
jgi:hypothetical protein